MINTLSTRFQTISVLAAISLAYIILLLPQAKMYSLQIFIVSILAFFVLKRLKGAKLWHILPRTMSLEIGLISFAVVFLIGATGNTHSVFFALSYIHLFFLVFSSSAATILASIIGLCTFHYALEPTLGTGEVGAIASLVVIAALFVFAKKQYDEVHSQELALTQEVEILDKTAQKEETLEQFITTFLTPKLRLLASILREDTARPPQALQQLQLLQSELDKIVVRTDIATPTKKIEN